MHMLERVAGSINSTTDSIFRGAREGFYPINIIRRWRFGGEVNWVEPGGRPSTVFFSQVEAPPLSSCHVFAVFMSCMLTAASRKNYST